MHSRNPQTSSSKMIGLNEGRDRISHESDSSKVATSRSRFMDIPGSPSREAINDGQKLSESYSATKRKHNSNINFGAADSKVIDAVRRLMLLTAIDEPDYTSGNQDMRTLILEVNRTLHGIEEKLDEVPSFEGLDPLSSPHHSKARISYTPINKKHNRDSFGSDSLLEPGTIDRSSLLRNVMNGQLEIQEQDAAQYEALISTLDSEIASANENIERLEEELKSSQDQCGQITQSLRQVKSQSDAFASKVTQLEAQVAFYQEDSKRVNETLTELKYHYDKAVNEAKHYQRIAEEKSSEIQGMTIQLQELNSKNQIESQQMNGQYQSQLMGLESRYQNRIQEIESHYQSQLQALQSQLNERLVTQEQIGRENHQLRVEMDSTKAKLEELNMTKMHLSKSNAELVQNLEQLRMESQQKLVQSSTSINNQWEKERREHEIKFQIATDKMNVEMNGLRNDCSQLQQRNQKLQQQIETIEHNAEKLREQVSQKDSNIAKMATELNAKHEALRSMEFTATNMQTEIQTLRMQNEDLTRRMKNESETLKESLRSTEQKLNKMTHDFEGERSLLVQQSNQKTNNMSMSNETLQREVSELRKVNMLNESKIKSLENDVRGFDRSSSEHQALVSRLQSEKEILQEKLELAKTEMRTMNDNQLAMQNDETATYENIVNLLESDLAKQKQECESLYNNISELEKSLANQQKTSQFELNELRKLLDVTSNENNDYAMLSTTLTTKVEALETENRKLRGQVDELASLNDTSMQISQKIPEYEQMIASLKLDKAKLSETIVSMEESNRLLMIKAEKLNENIREITNEKDIHSDEAQKLISKYKNMYVVMESNFTSLQEQLSVSTNQNNNLQSEMNELRKQMSELQFRRSNELENYSNSFEEQKAAFLSEWNEKMTSLQNDCQSLSESKRQLEYELAASMQQYENAVAECRAMHEEVVKSKAKKAECESIADEYTAMIKQITEENEQLRHQFSQQTNQSDSHSRNELFQLQNQVQNLISELSLRDQELAESRRRSSPHNQTALSQDFLLQPSPTSNHNSEPDVSRLFILNETPLAKGMSHNGSPMDISNTPYQNLNKSPPVPALMNNNNYNQSQNIERGRISQLESMQIALSDSMSSLEIAKKANRELQKQLKDMESEKDELTVHIKDLENNYLLNMNTKQNSSNILLYSHQGSESYQALKQKHDSLNDLVQVQLETIESLTSDVNTLQTEILQYNQVLEDLDKDYQTNLTEFAEYKTLYNENNCVGRLKNRNISGGFQSDDRDQLLIEIEHLQAEKSRLEELNTEHALKKSLDKEYLRAIANQVDDVCTANYSQIVQLLTAYLEKMDDFEYRVSICSYNVLLANDKLCENEKQKQLEKLGLKFANSTMSMDMLQSPTKTIKPQPQSTGSKFAAKFGFDLSMSSPDNILKLLNSNMDMRSPLDLNKSLNATKRSDRHLLQQIEDLEVENNRLKQRINGIQNNSQGDSDATYAYLEKEINRLTDMLTERDTKLREILAGHARDITTSTIKGSRYEDELIRLQKTLAYYRTNETKLLEDVQNLRQGSLEVKSMQNEIMLLKQQNQILNEDKIYLEKSLRETRDKLMLAQTSNIHDNNTTSSNNNNSDLQNSQIAILIDHINSNNQQLDDQQIRINQITQELDEYKNKLYHSELKSTELMRQVDDWQNKCDSNAIKINQLEDNATDLKISNESLMRDKEDAKREMRLVQSKHDEQIKSWKLQMEKTVNQLKSELREKDAMISSKDHTLISRSSQEVANNSEVVSLKKLIESYRKTITNLENELAHNTQKRKEAEDDVRQLQDRLSKYYSTSQENTAYNGRWHGNNQNSVNQLMLEKDKLQAMFNDIHSDWETQTIKIQEFERQMEILKDNNRHLSDTNFDLQNNTLANMRHELDEKNMHIRSLSDKISKLENLTRQQEMETNEYQAAAQSKDAFSRELLQGSEWRAHLMQTILTQKSDLFGDMKKYLHALLTSHFFGEIMSESVDLNASNIFRRLEKYAKSESAQIRYDASNISNRFYGNNNNDGEEIESESSFSSLTYVFSVLCTIIDHFSQQIHVHFERCKSSIDENNSLKFSINEMKKKFTASQREIAELNSKNNELMYEVSKLNLNQLQSNAPTMQYGQSSGAVSIFDDNVHESVLSKLETHVLALYKSVVSVVKDMNSELTPHVNLCISNNIVKRSCTKVTDVVNERFPHGFFFDLLLKEIDIVSNELQIIFKYLSEQFSFCIQTISEMEQEKQNMQLKIKEGGNLAQYLRNELQKQNEVINSLENDIERQNCSIAQLNTEKAAFDNAFYQSESNNQALQMQLTEKQRFVESLFKECSDIKSQTALKDTLNAELEANYTLIQREAQELKAHCEQLDHDNKARDAYAMTLRNSMDIAMAEKNQSNLALSKLESEMKALTAKNTELEIIVKQWSEVDSIVRSFVTGMDQLLTQHKIQSSVPSRLGHSTAVLQENLTAKLNDLSKYFSDQNQKNSHVTLEFERAIKEIRSKEESKKIMEIEIEKLSQMCVERESEIKVKADLIQSNLAKFTELNDIIIKLKQSNTKYQNSLENEKARRQESDRQLSNRNTEFAKLNSEYSKIVESKDRLSQELVDSKSRIQQLEEEIVSRNQAVSEQRIIVDKYQTILDNNQKVISELKVENHSMVDRLHELEKTQQTLDLERMKCIEMEKTISTLKADKERLLENQSVLMNNVSILTQELEANKMKLGHLDNRMENFANEKSTLNNENRKLSDDLNKMQMNINNEISKRLQIEKELENVRRSNEMERKSMEQQSKERIHEYEEIIEQIENETKRLLADRERSYVEVENWKKSAMHEAEMHKSIENEMKKLSSKLDKVNKELAFVDKRNENLKMESRRTKEKVSEVVHSMREVINVIRSDAITSKLIGVTIDTTIDTRNSQQQHQQYMTTTVPLITPDKSRGGLNSYHQSSGLNSPSQYFDPVAGVSLSDFLGISDLKASLEALHDCLGAIRSCTSFAEDAMKKAQRFEVENSRLQEEVKMTKEKFEIEKKTLHDKVYKMQETILAKSADLASNNNNKSNEIVTIRNMEKQFKSQISKLETQLEEEQDMKMRVADELQALKLKLKHTESDLNDVRNRLNSHNNNVSIASSTVNQESNTQVVVHNRQLLIQNKVLKESIVELERQIQRHLTEFIDEMSEFSHDELKAKLSRYRTKTTGLEELVNIYRKMFLKICAETENELIVVMNGSRNNVLNVSFPETIVYDIKKCFDKQILLLENENNEISDKLRQQTIFSMELRNQFEESIKNVMQKSSKGSSDVIVNQLRQLQNAMENFANNNNSKYPQIAMELSKAIAEVVQDAARVIAAWESSSSNNNNTRSNHTSVINLSSFSQRVINDNYNISSVMQSLNNISLNGNNNNNSINGINNSSNSNNSNTGQTSRLVNNLVKGLAQADNENYHRQRRELKPSTVNTSIAMTSNHHLQSNTNNSNSLSSKQLGGLSYNVNLNKSDNNIINVNNLRQNNNNNVKTLGTESYNNSYHNNNNNNNNNVANQMNMTSVSVDDVSWSSSIKSRASIRSLTSGK